MEPQSDFSEFDLDLDRNADWEELVTRYRGLLYAVCRRFSLSPAERDDAVQRTWLRLYEHRCDIRDPRRLAGWLQTTSRRECLKLRCARWKEDPVADLPVFERDRAQPDVADTVLTTHVAARLHEAVQQLPARERRLLQLLLEPTEPSYADVARILDMPIGSIGPVRGRAVRRLRLLLADLVEDNDPAAACG